MSGGHAAAAGAQKQLRVVSAVDLDRYMGRWYEVARYPNSYQDGHVAVIANYENRGEGKLGVVNTGRLNRLNGEMLKSTARGWVVEGSNCAKWKVQFLWPFEADYWIIDLGEDYEYAVVGQPSRKNLWILCRKPQMDEQTYGGICKRLRQQGYDTNRLQRTPQ
ncbi:MAG: lipocalin family protein [Planctomycetota bacterium]|jgi:apolipoprotein D and lipocalin family protein